MTRFKVVAFTTMAFSVAATADLSGKVSFKGAAPKNDAVKMSADPKCVASNTGKKVLKDDVAVSKGGGLANVFVYVKTGVTNPPAAPTTAVEFDQRGCMYVPRVFGVRAGQPIKIINSDPTLHNVHALPKSNPGFNMGMATKGQVIEKKFTKPEMGLKIKCDVHSWMAAYANVMDHPYFAVTDAEGAFNIPGLPAGEYTVEAWHEKLGTQTAKLNVAATGGKQDFTFGGAATN